MGRQSGGKARGYLTWVCFVAALGGFLFGFDTAVISGAIGFLTEQFSLDELMEGWVVASALFGCITGAVLAGMLSDRFGRKRVLIVSSVLFLISAVGCAIPQTLAALVVARLIGGIGVGVASMLSPLYIAELSPPHLRGRLVAFYQLAITIGVLVAYFSNAALQHVSTGVLADLPSGLARWIMVDEVWRAMFGAEAIPAMLFMLLLLMVPESPRWLAKQGRSEEARSVLVRVVGSDEAERELGEIRDAIAHEGGSILQLLRPGLRVALVIGIFLPIFSQVSGINVIIYYGATIFEEAGYEISASLGGLVVIGFINMAFTFIAIAVVDRFGRKPLLYLGVTGLATSLGVIGLLFQWERTNGPLLLVMFMVYVACFAFSLGPVPWIIISEIFPTRIRGRAMSVGTFAIWSSCTLLMLTFPWLRDNFGASRSFWLYAVLVAPALPFTWLLIPETKGKMLEEIEKDWEY